MSMRINLAGGHTATILSCCAPTLIATQDEKEDIYEQLSRVTRAVPHKDKLSVMGVGNFNARVGRDYNLRPKVIKSICHGIGNDVPNCSMG